MIVWALFDSGNGSYTKGVKELDKDIEIYPIGIDIENKNHHFIAFGRIWEYIERVLGFKIPFENHTRYNNYDNYPISKPTRFSGNIELNLKNEKKSNDVKFQEWTRSYNERSNIPQSLVCEIFEKVYKEIESEEKTRQPAIATDDSATSLTSH